MTLTLMINTQDNRVLNKAPSTIASVKVSKPTELVNVFNPVFYINYNANYLNANYCYCDTFKRYYYITDISLDNAKTMGIACSIDVLNTYKDQIKKCTGTCIRNSGIGKPTYITDSKLPIDPNREDKTSIRLVGSPFSDNHANDEDNLLLTVLRGDGNV